MIQPQRGSQRSFKFASHWKPETVMVSLDTEAVLSKCSLLGTVQWPCWLPVPTFSGPCSELQVLGPVSIPF